jgi:hypothetical protein
MDGDYIPSIRGGMQLFSAGTDIALRAAFSDNCTNELKRHGAKMTEMETDADQPIAGTETMSFQGKFISGGFGLAKTYWLFGAFGGRGLLDRCRDGRLSGRALRGGVQRGKKLPGLEVVAGIGCADDRDGGDQQCRTGAGNASSAKCRLTAAHPPAA